MKDKGESMEINRRLMRAALAILIAASASNLAAQTHEEAVPARPAPIQGAGQFPSRPPGDPATVARGKTAYMANCAYCHGDDARGGANGGTNLLRSDNMMRDRDGELLGPFLKSSTLNEHKFNFTAEQVTDIATFIHEFKINSRDPGRMRPPTVVVGDAKAGQAYFQSKCASCHSVTGDLQGIASRIDDPRNLQQTWLMPLLLGARPGGGMQIASAGSKVPPVTITVTQQNGEKVEGNLGRIDDFIVTLTQPDGTTRSFRREGDTPKVEVHDPLKPHKDLLPVYTDKNIHDVTAYLVTIK
jgi:cytochrome c oxidase cbb3-type subunit III